MISPFKQGEGDYKIILSDTFKLSVNAPGGQETELLYQPVTANDRLVKLRTLTAAGNADGSLFETELATPQDFNGEVWARVRYENGEIKETERLHLVVQSKPAKNDPSSQRQKESNTNTNTALNQTIDDNESARSDKKTGGHIERAALQTGDGTIRISVNVPAFKLTVWQNDKEIKTFYVGVGRRKYPIPIGTRTADKIILNPDWIPPDSQWVLASGIEPYERIPASSPDNPLGKIKIPLGDAYLLHEAQGIADIGNLVSHGCVRVLRKDLFDLTKMIVEARNLSISTGEINAAQKDSKRRVIDLGEEVVVDINYDTMVVEGDILNIYPDVYEQKTNTVEELRAELESYKVNVSKLDEATLKKMLDSVDGDTKFVVSLADISNGRALERGKRAPLTPFQNNREQKKNGKTKAG